MWKPDQCMGEITEGVRSANTIQGCQSSTSVRECRQQAAFITLTMTQSYQQDCIIKPLVQVLHAEALGLYIKGTVVNQYIINAPHTLSMEAILSIPMHPRFF